MKKIKFFSSVLAVAAMMSCQKDEITTEPTNELNELSKEHQEALLEAGVNPYKAFYADIDRLNESSVPGIKAGDIAIALEDLSKQALSAGEDGTKQYRTNNLVSRNQTISVIGYTGSCCALTTKMRTGLQWAVNNYNRVSTSLNFTLSFSASTSADMVIYNAGTTDAGGEAEFPSGGNPGKFIKIFGGMDNYDNNVNEHVVTHEMGHALGFRHTDYARRRCDGINEGTAGSIGAINVPGTPTANQWGQSGLDSDSIMISCFGGTEDGEFSTYDIVALEYLY